VFGPGVAELTWTGGGLAVTRADGTRTEQLEDPGGTLAAWLRGGHASVVVVRPDRIVRSARP
jgi:hypothetical protein